MVSSRLDDLSADPSELRSLTPEQRERLTDVLDRYLTSLGDHILPDRDRLLSDHPDLAEPLAAYLQHLEALHDAAGGFAAATDADSKWHAPDESPSGSRRLGDFILDREIGRGGMGVVYEAHQVSLQRRVALKVLPFAAVLNSKQIARFKNEAQAAAQLHHPNIVPVFAIGTERGVHYYAMQLIDGQPLDTAISQLRAAARHRGAADESTVGQGALDQSGVTAACTAAARGHRSLLTQTLPSGGQYARVVARLGIDAAGALHAAHEYGVVHRDIKPSNLLLDQNGKLWVTDFGLARCHADANLTQTGDLLGTARYMSPEQALGNSALVDHRTDIYSLGVTLYELLTLQPAFRGEHSRELLRRIEVQEPVRPRELRSDIPHDLETVVLKAMAENRDERYTTARDLADDLRRFLDGRPTVARPPTLLDRLTKWARRHRRLMLATVATCILLTFGLAVSTLLITRANLTAQQSLERAQEHYRQARGVVDLGTQVAERLAHIPAAQQVRQEFLQQLLAYYEQFAQQAVEDPTLRSDIALNYMKIGAIHAQIGSKSDALAAYEQALNLFLALSSSEPEKVDHHRYLARCHNELGLLLSDTGDVAGAMQAFQSAIDVQSRLAAAFPSDLRHSTDLALSQSNLALLQQQTGRVEQAEQSYQNAMRLHQTLHEAEPDAAEHLRGLAATHNNLGSLYVNEQPQKAVAAYERATELFGQLVARQPDNLEDQRSLATAHNNLGAVSAKLGFQERAEKSYSSAVAIQRRLVAAAPQVNSYRSDLSLSCNNLGMVQSTNRRSQQAAESFREALSLQEALVRNDPHDVTCQSTIGGVYNNLGVVLLEQQDYQSAAIALENAVNHQQIAFDAAPKMDRYRDFLSNHYYNYGRALRLLERPADAARAALQRKRLWPGDPQRLVTVAEELAWAVTQMRDDAANQSDAQTYADAAVATLQEALDAGFERPNDDAWPEVFSVLERQPAYAALRRHK